MPYLPSWVGVCPFKFCTWARCRCEADVFHATWKLAHFRNSSKRCKRLNFQNYIHKTLGWWELRNSLNGLQTNRGGRVPRFAGNLLQYPTTSPVLSTRKVTQSTPACHNKFGKLAKSTLPGPKSCALKLERIHWLRNNAFQYGAVVAKAGFSATSLKNINSQT